MRRSSLLLVLLALAIGFVAGRTLPSRMPGGSDGAPGASGPARAGEEGEPGPGSARRESTRGPSPDPAQAGEASTVPEAAPTPASLPGEPAAGLRPDEQADIEIFRRAALSVVHITSREYARGYFFNELQVREGTGSGFIWDTGGHIVTNFHVVQDASELKVKLHDQTTYDAEPVGVAPEKDLAVLRIKAPSDALRPLPLGRSAGLLVGQKVLAVGNPFGLDQSLTVGVVSALDRELQSPNGRYIHDVIQTDAAINPGNSGGPLLDSRGRLIGVNSAIYSPSGASAGIGFAIPVDTVRRLTEELIQHGHAIQPGIGITLLPDGVGKRFGLDGLIVHEVNRGGPAARAGLKGLELDRYGQISEFGDRVLAVNGEPVETLEDMRQAFEKAGVGATVTLTVGRGRTAREVRVTLAALN